jgi:hypothetical protein
MVLVSMKWEVGRHCAQYGYHLIIRHLKNKPIINLKHAELEDMLGPGEEVYESRDYIIFILIYNIYRFFRGKFCVSVQ